MSNESHKLAFQYGIFIKVNSKIESLFYSHTIFFVLIMEIFHPQLQCVIKLRSWQYTKINIGYTSTKQQQNVNKKKRIAVLKNIWSCINIYSNFHRTCS